MLTEANMIFRQNKGSDHDAVIMNPLTLKTKGSMNDVFLPIKAPLSQLRDCSFAHSAVPKIKLFLSYLR